MGWPTLDKRSGRGIHSFLAQVVSGVEPSPGLERVLIIGVYQDETVHLLYLLFSVLVDLYYTI